MKTLSKIIILIVALFSITFTSDAQWIAKWSGAQTTSYTGGTNKAMAVTTNAYFTIDVPKAGGDLALFCNYKFLNAPGAGDATGISLQLFRGIDSGIWETNAYLTWTIAGNSTTPASSILTTNVAGIPYLRARFINYSTNSHATNLLVYYGFKN